MPTAKAKLEFVQTFDAEIDRDRVRAAETPIAGRGPPAASCGGDPPCTYLDGGNYYRLVVSYSAAGRRSPWSFKIVNNSVPGWQSGDASDCRLEHVSSILSPGLLERSAG